MPTSVHIPKALLAAVDSRAGKLRLSRNRLIIRAIERELADGTSWSPEFFERLAQTRPEHARSVDEMLAAIRAHRTRKEPRTL